MSKTIEESRSITHMASAIITVLVTISFAAVWLLYYNDIVFVTHRELGSAICILLWAILYFKFCKIYRAFKIASNAIGETAFSQFLSICFADLILYVVVCLAARRYITFLPTIATAVLQSIIGFSWSVCAKHFFLNHVAPNRCLLLYDAEVNDGFLASGQEFIDKLENSYRHLFEIEEQFPVTDNLDEVYAKLAEYPVIFIYDMQLEKRSMIVNYCVNTDKRFYITPTIEDIVARGYDVKHFTDTPLMGYNGFFKSSQTYFGKRTCDILLSLIMIIITSPFMLIASIAIKIEDGGTVFFKQKRVGQGGKVFNILKFRSMIMDAEKDGKSHPAVAGDKRITKIGKVLRSTRLDELPQIFNILKGDLSLVGPRPERVEHVNLYTEELPEFSYRLRVPAGLTGYAQVYGKYNTSARDKLLLDLIYVEHQSFLLDMRIMFLTVKIMFMPESTEGFDEKNSEAIIQKGQDDKVTKDA